MFKWLCLLVAVVALGGLAWMVNDMRLEVRRTGQTIHQHLPSLLAKTDRVVQVVDQRLPQILARTAEMANTLNAHLPQTLEKAEKIAVTFAELSEDVKQLKELWVGANAHVRDQGIVAYANSVLTLLEAQEGTVGLRKKIAGKGLKSVVPIKEWTVKARREAFVLTFLVKSRAELLNRLCKNMFGSSWYIQLKDGEPRLLRDWIKANHPESKDL